MDLMLDGNTAIVTASTSGLGKASAAAFVREGANVTICGRSEDRLQAAHEEVAAAGSGEVLSVQADITDPDDIDRLVSATVAEFGGIDHLVTSAGGVPSGTFHDITEEEWRDSFELLVMSVVWTIDATHEYLKESEGGSIVNITSASVVEPIDNLILSNSVRKSVDGLMKSLAYEFAPEVRVNSVLPSVLIEDVDSTVAEVLESGDYESREEVIADWTAPLPLKQIGDPARLGDIVVFLSSERTNHTTGASVPVDGGRIRG